MTEAVLALRYNPQEFDVSAADVQLGSLTAGWQFTTSVNSQSGEIGIDLWSATPIQTTASGSLVTITVGSGQWAEDAVGSGQWAVGSNAGGGVIPSSISLVNQVDPTGQRLFTTTVADAQGAFALELNNGLWTENSVQRAAASDAMPAFSVAPPTFVNQVELPGQRVFAMSTADAQSALALIFKSGQWAENSEQLSTVNGQSADLNTPIASNETASDVEITASCPLPTAHCPQPDIADHRRLGLVLESDGTDLGPLS